MQELIQKVKDYIDGSITINDLELWLIINLPRYDSKDAEAVDIAYRIDNELAKCLDNVRSEDSIRSELYSLL